MAGFATLSAKQNSFQDRPVSSVPGCVKQRAMVMVLVLCVVVMVMGVFGVQVEVEEKGEGRGACVCLSLSHCHCAFVRLHPACKRPARVGQ